MIPEPYAAGPDGAPEKGAPPLEPFPHTLASHGLRLERGKTTTLQVNVGFRCNQTCRHCHLSAGPDRLENMDAATAEEVVAYAGRARFEVIDITGGAPELNPNLPGLIERLAPLSRRLMLRSNLTLLEPFGEDPLIALCRAHRVVIVASFPSLNEAQAEAQRGRGVFRRSIGALQRLNALGYGREGSGLELDLVANPTGAFLPTPQGQAEGRFRRVLEERWGIVFNRLFAFANVPLGRFRRWLIRSGNLESYMKRLAASFNPCAVEGLMCRTLVSVSWDGYLYDCDFNMARGLFLGGRKTHVSEMPGIPEPGSRISSAEHCYTCTAGSGFT